MDDREIILSSNPDSPVGVTNYDLNRFLCLENFRNLVHGTFTMSDKPFDSLAGTDTATEDIKTKIINFLDNESRAEDSGEGTNDEAGADESSQSSYPLITARDLEVEFRRNNDNKFVSHQGDSKCPDVVNYWSRCEEGYFVCRNDDNEMPTLSPMSQHSESGVDDQTMLPISQLTNAYPSMALIRPTDSNASTESPLRHDDDFLIDTSNKEEKETNECSDKSENRSKDKEPDAMIDLDRCLVKSLSPVTADLILQTFSNTQQVVKVLDKYQCLGEKVENKTGMTTMSERTTQENDSTNAGANYLIHPQVVYADGQISPLLFSDQCDQSCTGVELLAEGEKLVSCSNNGSTQNIIEINSMELGRAINEQAILIESDSESEERQVKKCKRDKACGSLPDKTEKSPKPCSYNGAIVQKHRNTIASTSPDHQQFCNKLLLCSRSVRQDASFPSSRNCIPVTKRGPRIQNTIVKYLEGVVKENDTADRFFPDVLIASKACDPKPVLRSKTKFKNMEQLLLMGVVTPGVNVLSWCLEASKKEATLLADGSMAGDGKIYATLAGWYKSVSGQKSVKLGTLVEEVLYKNKPIQYWISEHDRKGQQKAGKSKKFSQSTTNKDEISKNKSFGKGEEIGIGGHVVTSRSETSEAEPSLSIKHPARAKVDSSLYFVNDKPKVSSTEAILRASDGIDELFKDEDRASDVSYVHVRLLTNEELFPFSQEEWDASFDDPSIAESLVNWV